MLFEETSVGLKMTKDSEIVGYILFGRLDICSFRLTADDLRQIADKLDELNEVIK